MPLQWRNQFWQNLEEGAGSEERTSFSIAGTKVASKEEAGLKARFGVGV